MEPILSKTPRSLWEFAPFKLDKANALLWRNDEIVPLRPKNFAALCYLVERHGELVTKSELLDHVWEHRYVSESVLKVCINELRQALGDDAHAPKYLVTVARRGYRFIASVNEFDLPKKAKKSAEGLANGIFPILPSANRSGYWVARHAAQAKLQDSWQHSLNSLRQIVFLTGEPGIGKTTLIEMFLEDIHHYAPMVLRMRCVEHFGQGEALLPIIEAIEKRCRAPEGSKLIQLLHQLAPVWLAQLPSVLQPEEREALQREIFGASRERMIREGCELLETLSREAPLILVFEDIHWSDSATLDFLSLLARRSEAAALMVLASYRPLDISSHEYSVATLHRELHLRGSSSEIAMDPFSPEEVADYLGRRLPGVPISNLSQALLTRTGGNPLFVSNLVEYLVGQDQWPLPQECITNKALPDTIRRVIEREIERLSVDEQRILAAASAIGSSFSVVLLSAVLDIEMGEVDRCCDALCRRGQILLSDGMEQAEQGDVVGRYTFRHDLYVEVLYSRIAPGHIIRLHLRIGECLERLHSKDLKLAAELALHFEKGWDWVRAVHYLGQAATNATNRFANPQACDYLLHALELVNRLPVREQAEAQIRLRKQSADTRRSMGDMTGAQSDLEDMLATAIASGNSLAKAFAQIELSRILAWLNRHHGLGLARQAVIYSKELDDNILQSLVSGMYDDLNLLFRHWRAAHAKTCHAAMNVARATADPLVRNSWPTQHIATELLPSCYKRACATAEEALALSRTLGDRYISVVGHYYYCLALLHMGEWGKLRQICEESRLNLKCSDESFPRRLHRQILLAWLHVEAGGFSGAKAYCEMLLQSLSRMVTFVSVHCSAVLGRELLGLKDYEGAIRCFEFFFQAEQDESLPIFCNNYFSARQGACQAWLSLRELRKAHHYAQKLQDLSADAPEHTYLAISYCLIGELAIKENSLDEAVSQMTKTMGIVECGAFRPTYNLLIARLPALPATCCGNKGLQCFLYT